MSTKIKQMIKKKNDKKIEDRRIKILSRSLERSNYRVKTQKL